jgi:hypothetical protein
MPPYYGAFKHGDPAHKGYNKTIGANWPYIEDPEVDTVKYHPNKTFDNTAKPPVWRDPTNAQSTPMKTIHDNFRNAAREDANQLMRSFIGNSMGQSLYVQQMVNASRKKQ